DGEPEVDPRLALATELLEALAECELRVVRRRVEVQERLERRARRVVLAGVEVRPPERLEDRRLRGLKLRRPLEDDRGLRVMAPLEEALAALQQLIRRLAVGGIRRRDAVLGHARSLHESPS